MWQECRSTCPAPLNRCAHTIALSAGDVREHSTQRFDTTRGETATPMNHHAQNHAIVLTLRYHPTNGVNVPLAAQIWTLGKSSHNCALDDRCTRASALPNCSTSNYIDTSICRYNLYSPAALNNFLRRIGPSAWDGKRSGTQQGQG